MVSSQPSLDDIQYLIIDEIHERDIHCDVALAVAPSAEEHRIRLILMSATLDAEKFPRS